MTIMTVVHMMLRQISQTRLPREVEGACRSRNHQGMGRRLLV
jgi:hypothetical protein